MSLPTVEILGIPFVNTTQAGFVQQLDEHLANEEKVFTVTANPEIAMKAIEDAQFKTAIDKARISLPMALVSSRRRRYLASHCQSGLLVMTRWSRCLN